MALFYSPWKTQIFCPRLQRNCEIQRPFSSRSSISTTSKFEISMTSILASATLINPVTLKVKCCSGLSSSVELDRGSPSSSIVFVKGLAQSTSERGLKTSFSQFGEVSGVKIIYDKITKQPLGFAYVWFTTEEQAKAAVEEMNGKFFDGRFIHVTIARPGSCKPRPKATPYRF